MAAALALLGFLGSSSGPRVDIWAHLFGFLSGATTGFLVSRWLPYAFGPGVQWASGAGAAVVIVGSWITAFK
jgi:membrane associated rhomboid family serine protease